MGSSDRGLSSDRTLAISFRLQAQERSHGNEHRADDDRQDPRRGVDLCGDLELRGFEAATKDPDRQEGRPDQ
jgi:hypothetical protein